MTHQELDDLFRANSERGEFAPELGEWEEMTAMLDEDERRERYARWVSIGWMSLFVVLIASGVYGLWSIGGIGSEPAPTSKEVVTPVAEVPSIQRDVNIADATQNPLSAGASTQSSVEDEALFESSVDQAQGSIQVDASAKPAASSFDAGTSRADIAAATHTAKTSKLANERSHNGAASPGGSSLPSTSSSQRASQVLAKADTRAAVVPSTFPLNVGGKKSVSEELQPTLSFTSAPALPQTALVPFTVNEASLSQEVAFVAPPNVLAEARSWSKYSLGLFVAEELTSVAMSKEVRLGTRVGALLHYKPFRQWSVDLGVSYAHKSYMAPDGEMKNTLGLFVDDVLPSQTDGECDILEIPLTVSFLPQGHGQAGPFVSAGLLSYRIFREQMVFHYDEPTSQVQGAMAPDMGSLFGTLHFQAGYRFVPKRGPAWRVGPYVQVPMTMVGSGKLPIYSGGFQVEVELF